MSRRKHERRLEERYGSPLTPWTMGILATCALLVLLVYIGTMPLSFLKGSLAEAPDLPRQALSSYIGSVRGAAFSDHPHGCCQGHAGSGGTSATTNDELDLTTVGRSRLTKS